MGRVTKKRRQNPRSGCYLQGCVIRGRQLDTSETLIAQDLVHFSTSSLTGRFLADARIAVLRCELHLETRRIILPVDWDDEEDDGVCDALA